MSKVSVNLTQIHSGGSAIRKWRERLVCRSTRSLASNSDRKLIKPARPNAHIRMSIFKTADSLRVINSICLVAKILFAVALSPLEERSRRSGLATRKKIVLPYQQVMSVGAFAVWVNEVRMLRDSRQQRKKNRLSLINLNISISQL